LPGRVALDPPEQGFRCRDPEVSPRSLTGCRPVPARAGNATSPDIFCSRETFITQATEDGEDFAGREDFARR
jgi:hypothetical protein